MKKLISPIMIAAIMVGIIAILFSSCKRDGAGKPRSETCSVTGTLVHIGCVTSAMNNLWIRTDDGKYMQPCEVGVATPEPFYAEGMRIKFGYKPNKTSACGNVLMCSSVPPGYESVTITCLELLDQDPCNTFGTLVHAKPTVDNPNCTPWLIEADGGKVYEPVNQDMLNHYGEGSRVKFSFQEVYTLVATCSGAQPVQVTCITAVPFCGTTVCPGLTMSDDTIVNNGVNIISAHIEGEYLKLKVGYSGCAPHSEKMIMKWNGSVMRNRLFMVSLGLEDTQPQLCMAYFEEEICYELTSLRKAIENGPITIKVKGYEDILTYGL